ncbi:hypothetical protein TNCV_183711 [Trichonephila clavipes]|nr:hypothetical protein TNCV_183711 [Trichonephila clavipes]
MSESSSEGSEECRLTRKRKRGVRRTEEYKRNRIKKARLSGTSHENWNVNQFLVSPEKFGFMDVPFLQSAIQLAQADDTKQTNIYYARERYDPLAAHTLKLTARN